MGARRRRCGVGRRVANVEDADLPLSRQPRHQGGQRALCAWVPLPPELANAKRPLIVGLTNDPERLIQLRRNRLTMMRQDEATEYTDLEAVRAEVREARRVFGEHHWPVIDVTRRSIEETAAAIMKLLARRHGIAE